MIQKSPELDLRVISSTQACSVNCRSEQDRTAEPVARLCSEHMSEEREEQERTDRDRERSEEAHWRAAEAAAEGEDPPSRERSRRHSEEDDWENEGGALDQESDQGADDAKQD